MRYAIGVDLGGTKTALGIVDEKGELHARAQFATQVDQGPLFIQAKILEEIKKLIATFGNEISGIGFGVAGQIEIHTGKVLFGPNLNWHDVPLQNHIQTALHLPVCVMNDVRAATYGEWKFGAGKGCQDLLCVFLGTGIGSGVVSGGHLLTGCSNTFGEIGHMTMDTNGPFCPCGRRGCLEAFAGGRGIAARMKEMLLADPENRASQSIVSKAGGIDHVTAKIVCQAYLEKNPLAETLLNHAQQMLIAGFSNLINLYNPRRLIIGGGLIDGMPQLIQILDKGIKKESLKAATETLEVVKARLGKLSGVIGAAAPLFIKNFNIMDEEYVKTS